MAALLLAPLLYVTSWPVSSPWWGRMMVWVVSLAGPLPAAMVLRLLFLTNAFVLVRITLVAWAPAPLAAPPVKTGNVRLQLGSVHSAAAARLEWGRILQRNSDLLGSLAASPVRADLGDKGVYYRIETGPIGLAAADRLCGALRARKVGCVIVR